MSAAPPQPPRRGPRNDDTRGRILSAARAEFAESGFDAATVRAIATRAGVNPAMINHYFGGKEGLFREVVAMPVDPAQVLAAVIEGPTEELGRRLALAALRVWESPQTGPAMLALFRSRIADPERVRPVREYIAGHLVQALGGHGEAARLDAALMLTHIAGILIGRYVVELPELCEPSIEELADRVGPVLQQYVQTSV